MRYVLVFVYLSIIIAELPFELAQAYSPYISILVTVYKMLPVYSIHTSTSKCQTMQSHKTRLAIRDDMVNNKKMKTKLD